MIASLGVLIGVLFLEETYAEKKCRHDTGLETGRWILSKLLRCVESKALRNEKAADLNENLSLLSRYDQPPGYCTTEGLPKLPSTVLPEPYESVTLNDVHIVPRSKPAATKAFTR